MQIESFLFTRTQRYDFTAFVRPAGMTNREISLIASALGAINDVDRLTRTLPGVYCFALGEYVWLLRHYDSGRKHAGRSIGVVEGIAARLTWARHFALAVPYLLAHQDDVLNTADGAGDIETLTPMLSSLNELPDRTAVIALDDTRYIEEFLARRGQDRLHVTFDKAGLILLAGALAERRFLPPLYFAFGTNRDVTAAFASGGIDFDVIGWFNTEQPCFRSRETGQKTGDISLPVVEAALDNTRPHAPGSAEEAADTPLIAHRVEPIDLPPPGGADELPEAERMLTPRQLRQQMQMREQTSGLPTSAPERRFDPFAALRRLVRLLTGRE